MSESSFDFQWQIERQQAEIQELRRLYTTLHESLREHVWDLELQIQTLRRDREFTIPQSNWDDDDTPTVGILQPTSPCEGEPDESSNALPIPETRTREGSERPEPNHPGADGRGEDACRA